MSPEIISFVFLAFLLAGAFKGLTGLGLPAMSLGLMVLVIQLHNAMAILVIPLFVTNVWQGVTGGHFHVIVLRLWTLFVSGIIGIWLAVGIMVDINPTILTILLGTVLAAYAAYSIITPFIGPPQGREAILSPIVGFITGVIAGMTGSMAVPSVPYMQALGMRREALIQAMGIWFCLGSISLGGALGEQDALSPDLTIISIGAVAPAIIGMEIGRRLRQRLSETFFRRIFYSALFFLGLFITGRGVYQI